MKYFCLIILLTMVIAVHGLILPPIRCPMNEYYTDCGPACQESCASLFEPNSCINVGRVCFKGCVCRKGLVRTNAGRCVPPVVCIGR